MRIRPLRDLVLIEMESVKTESNGFALPEKSQQKPQQGRAVACGPKCEHVSIGNRLEVPKHGENVFHLGGKEIRLYKESEVFAILGDVA